MGPKKKDAKAKAGPKKSDEIGQLPENLLKTYSDFCKRIGLDPHPRVHQALTNEENPHMGRQIIIDCGPSIDVLTGDKKQEVQLLGSGGCRALCTAILGAAPTMPKDPETNKPLIYKQIAELRIWQSNIGDDGAQSIAEVLRLGGAEVKIAYLELFNNNICAPGAYALGRSLQCACNQSLMTLSLDYNLSLKSEGCAALCLGLRTNSTLKKLSLRYCDLDEESGAPLGEVLSFGKCGLNILDLMGNNMRGQGLKDLMPGFRRNVSLTTFIIADNNIGGDANVDLEGLQDLCTVCCTHPTLTSLDLNYNRIGQSGADLLLPLVDPINGNKKVTSIKVDSTLPDEIFKKLSVSGGGGGKKKGKGKKKKCDIRLKTNIMMAKEGRKNGRIDEYEIDGMEEFYELDYEILEEEGYFFKELEA
jgi:hypothetical protein